MQQHHAHAIGSFVGVVVCDSGHHELRSFNRLGFDRRALDGLQRACCLREVLRAALPDLHSGPAPIAGIDDGTRVSMRCVNER